MMSMDAKISQRPWMTDSDDHRLHQTREGYQQVALSSIYRNQIEAS